MTYGDPFADAEPFFWCEECYQAMHYNPEGKLHTENFLVFKYTHE